MACTRGGTPPKKRRGACPFFYGLLRSKIRGLTIFRISVRDCCLFGVHVKPTSCASGEIAAQFKSQKTVHAKAKARTQTLSTTLKYDTCFEVIIDKVD